MSVFSIFLLKMLDIPDCILNKYSFTFQQYELLYFL